MKNKLVFRILGALASALIIASVFIPFVSVTGYSQSLWQTYEAINTLYLPIMIIVFGVIGVLSFAVNIKTELAYTSTGALLFFLITQTIPVIEQNLFNTFSVGYYCLVVGTIVTGIMAFICNLKSKKKEKSNVDVMQDTTTQMSVIDQIDKLYDDQALGTNNSNTEINNVIEPISMDPLNSVVEPIQPIEQVSVQNNNSVESLQQVVQPIESVNTTFDVQVIDEDNSVSNEVIADNQPVMENNQIQSVNPVINEFNNQTVQPVNPVTAEFNNPAAQPVNPVTAEFNNPATQPINPVTAEFNNPAPPVETQQVEPVQELQPTEVEMIQPISNEPKVDVMADTTNNNDSNLDIFG